MESLIPLAVLIGAIAALVLAFRRLPRPYGVYGLLFLLVSIASPTLVQPLQGLDRYVLVDFPMWMAAGSWLASRPVALRFTVPVGAALLAFYAFEFGRWAFIA